MYILSTPDLYEFRSDLSLFEVENIWKTERKKRKKKKKEKMAVIRYLGQLQSKSVLNQWKAYR